MTVAYPRLTPCHPAGKTFELWNLLPRYVHPAVMQAAEAGCVACYTEIPTDDVALQVGQRGDDMSNSKNPEEIDVEFSQYYLVSGEYKQVPTRFLCSHVFCLVKL